MAAPTLPRPPCWVRAAGGAVAAGLAAAWLLGRPAGPRLLRPAELGQYRGGGRAPGLFLAVLGRVFDVLPGGGHYGPGRPYSHFAGRDASRAFVTGDFSETGLVDDVSDLSPAQMLTLHNWLLFYEKNYEFVGKLVGRFYGEDGEPTQALVLAEAAIAEGLRARARDDELKRQFPPCNSEWSAAGGSRFWCSRQSGGVSRDWVGVPRRLYQPGPTGPQCVCVRPTGPPSDRRAEAEDRGRGDLDHPSLQEFEGCAPLAAACVPRG
ncbi:neuferricin [Ornithorhynchus anatinus]|uniref:Neuferricin n=1 Tax=Ornithorhynchus anatinus TaxID=9258 RepID=A0A6I8PDM6_ORNAN|nr:neuferricin [Ornithorhynchus anatinus]